MEDKYLEIKFNSDGVKVDITLAYGRVRRVERGKPPERERMAEHGLQGEPPRLLLPLAGLLLQLFYALTGKKH